ncbi:hypothetical protein SAMN04490243_1140 [Robiginitalea myxolifaciens]|uniref:Chain length determinant protein n=1 Tax=Robiginitalea myxolifaciens TaxID=400055 RepID=A0A1I6G2W4_9FLAO|nr:hypothetical protein [Robiginitalea myxolifaciens]SFR36471.1 hypothetical protein SAMN04490243_1140 [Robiginitalea myxolifaciens]
MTQKNANSTNADDIDLGGVFKLFKEIGQSFFRGILGIFLFFKRNIIGLLVVILLGVAIGYGLDKFVAPKYALDVILSPNLDSRNYLYTAVQEARANLKSGDSAFYASLELSTSDRDALDFELSTIPEATGPKTNQDMKYLQLLQDFGGGTEAPEIIRAELRRHTPLEFLLRFEFGDPVKGTRIAEGIVDYINENPYYTELVNTVRTNARERIAFSDSLLMETDELLRNFNEKMLRSDSDGSARLVLDGEQDLNIAEILEIKRGLQRDIEIKNLELSKIQSGISVISFGRAHRVEKSLLERRMVLFPLLLLSLFLFFRLLQYLNQKASAHHME